MPRRCLALIAIAVFATAGCAGRSWPNTAISAANPAIADAVTVDVLPIDLAVWTEPGSAVSPAELRGRLEARILNAAMDAVGP